MVRRHPRILGRGRRHLGGVVALLAAVAALPARAGDAAAPRGEPVLEPPTLHSLGVYWVIGGDDNGRRVERPPRPGKRNSTRSQLRVLFARDGSQG